MTVPSAAELTLAIADATRDAARELFRRHPGRFYYFALVSTGEAHAPYVSAWSWEALARAGDKELKWSHADSPFCGYGWDEHFGRVRALFDRRPTAVPDGDPEQWNREYDLRYSCMEAALRGLDGEGLFGTGPVRNGIVINAEVMPPDRTNVERAKRLNPPEALTDWLAEAAEPE